MGMQYIAIGMMAIGMLGAAFAVGNIFSALMEGISRNPEAEDKLKKYVYVGAGMAEAIGIFCLVIAIMLVFGVGAKEPAPMPHHSAPQEAPAMHNK